MLGLVLNHLILESQAQTVYKHGLTTFSPEIQGKVERFEIEWLEFAKIKCAIII